MLRPQIGRVRVAAIGNPRWHALDVVSETADDGALDALLSAGDYEAYVTAEKGA